MRRILPLIALMVAVLTGVPAAHAGGGPLGIDHRLGYDNAGIWKRSYQVDLGYCEALCTLAAASLEGGRTRFGRTLWQSVDAMAFSSLASLGLKYTFGRQRPSYSANPNLWFSGGQSFPSGEVTEASSFVTPFIAEYQHDHPWVWALALIPAYDAEARMKTWGHWQTDVLAGAALGTAFGIWAHDRKSPLLLSWLPGGFMVGYAHRF